MPSTEEMLSEVQKEYDEKIKANVVSSRFYLLGGKMRQYFHELYDLGNCKPFPPVIFDVFTKNKLCFENDYDNLRNHVYEVIDDYTYSFR